MAAEGADLVDVGGESTRPGAEPVAADEELRRVMPVIERLGQSGSVPLSIDTSKAVVARAATDAGAVLVNDVTALRGDAGMAAAVAESGAEVCLMHMLGEPRTMQDDPRYEDVVSEVKAFLEERLEFAVARGIAEERDLARSRDRLRQDGRAQPRAAAAAGRDRGAGAPGGRGRVSEAVHRRA